MKNKGVLTLGSGLGNSPVWASDKGFALSNLANGITQSDSKCAARVSLSLTKLVLSHRAPPW